MDGSLWFLCDLAVGGLLWELLRYRGVNPLVSLAPLVVVLLLENPVGPRGGFRPSPLAGFISKGILAAVGAFRSGKPLLEWHDERIDSMEPTEFERFVGRLFELRGYSVRYTARTGDFGVDVVIEKESLRMAIQCKHQVDSVGVKAVQEVYGGLRLYQCQHALVVKSNRFTPAAVRLAKSNGVGLWDRKTLKQEVLRTRAPAGPSPSPWWRTDGARRLAALLLGKWVYYVRPKGRARGPQG